MNKLRKALSLVLVLVLAVALSVPAYAQTVGTAAEGTGSITINNATRGVTYKVFKLFDATIALDGTDLVSIAYTGDIPASLASYFTKNATTGEITAASAELSAAAVAALKAWAEATPSAKVAEATSSDGSALVFQGLAYGYYVVTTEQGGTAGAISVDSLTPNAVMYDKNTTPPIANPAKTIDDTDVYIGQTVTYTVSFDTANFTAAGEAGKRILSYIITDTPATGSLRDIVVTGITVGGTAITTQQFDANHQITIPWVDANNNSLYANGAKIVVTYTAVVADTAAIAGAGNTNTVVITYTYGDPGDPPNPPGGGGSDNTVTATFKTYAIAVKKVNKAGADLAGAVFQLPFYVKSAAAADGAYIYAGTTAGDGLTNTLTTPANGLIIIKGLQSATAVQLTETEAPDGYNKLSDPVTVTPQATEATSTSTTTYLDENGNIVSQHTQTGHDVLVEISALAATPVVVVNKAGTELPSTGGIGTTIFYVVGAVLAVGAAAILVSRKRVSD